MSEKIKMTGFPVLYCLPLIFFLFLSEILVFLLSSIPLLLVSVFSGSVKKGVRIAERFTNFFKVSEFFTFLFMAEKKGKKIALILSTIINLVLLYIECNNK